MATSYGERYMQALNSKEPVIIESLARGSEFTIQAVVTRNPHITPELLSELSVNQMFIVRKGVANNANTPLEILSALTFDKDDQVADTARATLDGINSKIAEV